MIMIHHHLIASQSLTMVFDSPSDDSTPVTKVNKGSWLGEIERIGDWIRVITTEYEGWVKKTDVEILPPMGLHVVWKPGQAISYMHLSNAS